MERKMHMAYSSKHAKSVSRMTTAQLQSVIASGSLLVAAAKYELAQRKGK
jgi:hypothetical protein